MEKIKLKKILRVARFPVKYSESFPSVKDIEDKIKKSKKLSGVTVIKIGQSRSQEEISMLRFGQGKLKVLIVGFPHPNEPIGALTIFSLLSVIEHQPELLNPQEIEWNIIPCIDPLGARLNEGWSMKKFSLERFMKFYFRQAGSEQVEWSFPISYKKLKFSRPSIETKILMRVIKKIKPDIYYSLHNSMVGGAYYFLGGAVTKGEILQYKNLLKANNVPLHLGEREVPWVHEFEKAFYGEVSVKNAYDYYSKFEKNPSKAIHSGASSFDFIKSINLQAKTLICELPYAKHCVVVSQKKTQFNRRKLGLVDAAHRKFVESLMVDIWDRVYSKLNKNSPFYMQYKRRIKYMKSELHQLSRELLSESSYNCMATEAEYFDSILYQYFDLCWEHQFVRLLKDSKQGKEIRKATIEFTKEFNLRLQEIKQSFPLEEIRIIPTKNLVNVQLGSLIIAINNSYRNKV